MLRGVRDHSEDIVYYLAFLIALEFALRLLMGFANLVLVRDRARTPDAPSPPDDTQPPPTREG